MGRTDLLHSTGLYFESVQVHQQLTDLSRLLVHVGTVALLYGGFIVTSHGNVLAAEPCRAVLAHRNRRTTHPGRLRTVPPARAVPDLEQ
jgi:hypothetical protein